MGDEDNGDTDMRMSIRKICLLGMVFLLSLASVSCSKKEEEKSGAMSDQVSEVAVETETVRQLGFTRERTYVGNVSAAKASERILKFPWENGDYVQKGQMIAEIRNEVSRKGLDAIGAQIKSVDAQLKAAERELKRVQSMYESNIVSRQNYDKAQDAVVTLMASKQQLLATQEQSKLGLDYARVVAPIDGVISHRFFGNGFVRTPRYGDAQSHAQHYRRRRSLSQTRPRRPFAFRCVSG